MAVTYLLHDGRYDPIKSEHDVGLCAKHDSQQIFKLIGIDLSFKQPFGRHQQMTIVVLGRVVAFLDTERLCIWFSESEFDRDGIYRLSMLGCQLFCDLFAAHESRIKDLSGN